MKIEVYSKAAVVNAVKDTSEPTLIISINCPVDDPAPDFGTNPMIKQVVPLFFDDVEEGVKYDTPVRVISSEDAEAISKAVIKWKDTVTRIVVHCWAGMSRSAGVAAAIGKYLDGDDSFIFNRPCYHPNSTCYRKVLESFYGEKMTVDMEKFK